MNDSTSNYPSCGLFRVRAIPIVAQRPLRHGEHQQHYSSDQRYQVYEYPPARAVYVVEPPYGHGQARNEDGQAVDPAQQPCAGIGAAGAKQGVDPPQHYGYYDVEEHEVPVLLAPGSATEHGILLECFKVPAQLTASPFSEVSRCPSRQENLSAGRKGLHLATNGVIFGELLRIPLPRTSVNRGRH